MFNLITGCCKNCCKRKLAGRGGRQPLGEKDMNFQQQGCVMTLYF